MNAVLAAAPARAAPASRHRFVDQPGGLRRIHRDEIDALIWRRRLEPALAAQAQALCDTGNGLLVDACCSPDRMRSRLLATAGQAPFRIHRIAHDVERLARHFAALAGTASVRAQLEILDHQPCPLFHVDNNVLRMVCSYTGPGTEYVDERHLRRDRLRRNDNEGVLGGQPPLVTGTGQVILMKGERNPSARGHGAVHRSPPLAPGQRRLLLRLDCP